MKSLWSDGNLFKEKHKNRREPKAAASTPLAKKAPQQLGRLFSQNALRYLHLVVELRMIEH